MCIHVLKSTLRYLLIAEIIEMAQPAPEVNLPRLPLHSFYAQIPHCATHIECPKIPELLGEHCHSDEYIP